MLRYALPDLILRTKIIFWDLRGPIIDNLYKPNVSESRLEVLMDAFNEDDEYFAALQADREKELKFMQEAERRQLEEAASREASLERERHQEEENRRKMLEEEEFKRELAAKEASLPQEPGPDDESVVTLIVRMPDGSRQGRRFSKSDRLQFLFDFIDIGRLVKPGTYRLTRVLVDDLRAVTQGSKSRFGVDSKTLLRILCHRVDSEASQFLKKQFKIPKSAG